MTKKPKKKKKAHSPTRDLLVYIVMRLVGLTIQAVPTRISLSFARFLGHGMYLIYERGRTRAHDNLRQAFPDKPQEWIEHTARRSFEHLVMLVFDVFNTTRLIRRTTWHRYIHFENIGPALEHILDGRGVIMVTGHYGNFEVLGYALATFGLSTYSVGRPIDNPYVNKYLYGVRQKQGQTIIDKKGAAQDMQRILASGAALGLVADQNGSKKDIFVDFFGKKAATYKSIGLLAMNYNVPIVVGSARRLDDDYKFCISISRVITPEQWQDQPDPLHWITQEYTTAIEDFIGIDPEQYWWIHRRWKTRPPEERKKNKNPA